MSFTKGQFYILFLAIISVLLFSFMFQWIEYLFENNYIKEAFQTSHSVDLPLTTTYSCQNFCNPSSRCAITGQQCFTDIDCPGCQPYKPPAKKNAVKIDEIVGDDAAGKLTVNVTPRYSSLTTDIGTKAKAFPRKQFSKAPLADYGIDIWRNNFDEQEKLFNKRYKPNQLQYMPNYSKRYSVTGEFVEEGPISSNATLD
jgi:hypothetical protein